jgi:hypothetical protein
MADPVQPQRPARSVQFDGGDKAQFLQGSGTRVNATAGAASTAEAAVPTGGNVIFIRATDAVAIRFGATGMAAAAVDANSILFCPGEAPYVLKTGEAFFRVIRVGAADVPVQLESVATL